jgi:antitoxin (DNA-binding transcriptional repressor) of toxin-antitoxin stability system
MARTLAKWRSVFIMDGMETKMERHEISAEAIDWPSLVRHVVRDRVTVELADGEKPIAMLVPIEPPRTMADLDRALRQLPRLGEDAERFESDVQEVRSSMKELDDPWES